MKSIITFSDIVIFLARNLIPKASRCSHCAFWAVVFGLSRSALGQAPANDQFAIPEVIAGVSAEPMHTKVFSFKATNPAIGSRHPRAGLVEGTDGDFYGTTWAGGANDYGTVFKVTPGGVLTTLVEFTGDGITNKGASPFAGLVQGTDGNFYGTTWSGGAGGNGTVFKMTPAGLLTTLVEFTGNGGSSKGEAPLGELVQSTDGNFYGTTYGDLTYYGTVFKMTPDGVLTTLVEFTGNGTTNKGAYPSARLVQGTDGNFYGTTEGGGASYDGTVFKMTPAGALTTLVEFTRNGPSNKGGWPNALVMASDGNFYGTTTRGGASDLGTTFKMTPAGALTTLVEFTRNGASPHALLQSSAGNFYGTTFGGGAGDYGTVFMMTPTGVLTTLVEFTGNGTSNKGNLPNALVQGSDGNLYGTTFAGGASDYGTVFKMTLAGEMTTLVEFTRNGTSIIGSQPEAGLVQGSDGNLYGTTFAGGASDYGTVFKMTLAGLLTTLVEFTGNLTSNKGASPRAGLVQGSGGNFYGTTSRGGANDYGTVFRMTPAGELTTLVEFTSDGAANKGSHPFDLVRGNDGNFYGMTSGGGARDHGTIFRMTPGGELVTLVELGTTNQGRYPVTGLVQGSDGNFYGTTSRGGVSDYGTVFRMTPAGAWTTLVEFTGNGVSNKGSFPTAGLVQSRDGNFYGTTQGGGANADGTVFRMTPDGVLTTLVEFTGNGISNKGRAPSVALLRGSDGNFYGTTYGGGVSDYGTVFRMTPAGVLTTLYDFANDSADFGPSTPLIAASDGNLYGTTSGNAGSIYCMVFPGTPNVFPLPPPLPPEQLTSSSAVLQAKVNPRGWPTVVSLEYGNDGIAFPNQVPVPLSLTGYQSILVGRTLRNLIPGTTYYYRFRATSGAGETLSPVLRIFTVAKPTVEAALASEVTPTSAQLNGLVNARNYEATVSFEWGMDGNSYPHSAPAVPERVIGNAAVPVSAPVAGLVPGQTYYYRIVATNIGGTAVSGQRSFRTLTEPIAALSGASPVSTTRARVEGTVNAKGSEVTVRFEYGTNTATFANSEAAFPEVVAGEESVAVSATLRGLTQGTTYYYRIRASGPGGTGVSETGTFTLNILSGLVQAFPDPPPPSTGTLTVIFDPPGKGAWRFAGGGQWLGSGVPATNLASGERLIEFLPLPGFIHPLEELVDVVSGEDRVLERSYFGTPVSGSGSLTVYLQPENLAPSAQWNLVNEAPLASGAERAGLPGGTYLIECKHVDGWVTPSLASVSIEDGRHRELTLTYFRANETIGDPPRPLTFAEVSRDESLPFAYVGQLRSEIGSSTGFVVKRRVVATAGHVVFDDGTLSFLTRLQWLFQRYATQYEPRPQVPRGYYLAAGYAARRAADASPGESSPPSQHLDYAALYFLEEAGRGGFGGFLASESSDDNEFLDSSSDKTLAGYAIDGIQPADQGKLFATPIFTQALSPAFGETWTTLAVYGVGGCSGGPLFVRHSNGNFYPAAIYLGGSGQTVVRAIDQDVIELFDRAEISANGGGNNTSGGISHTEVTAFGSPSDPGALKVFIEPAAATNAGARWMLVPSTALRPSGFQKAALAPGTYTLDFTTVEGFPVPSRTNVVVIGGSLTSVTFTYGSRELEDWRQAHFGTTENTGPAADDADPDGDGSSNINEFVAGTDPNDRNDRLRILSLTRKATSCELQVTGKKDRIYELQIYAPPSSAEPNHLGVWTTRASVGPLSADTQLTLTDPVNQADRAIYRVRVTRP